MKKCAAACIVTTNRATGNPTKIPVLSIVACSVTSNGALGTIIEREAPFVVVCSITGKGIIETLLNIEPLTSTASGGGIIDKGVTGITKRLLKDALRPVVDDAVFHCDIRGVSKDLNARGLAGGAP
jgi:hypothetical protein